MYLAEDALADRCALLGHLKKQGAIGCLIRLAFFPSTLGAAFPRPPVLAICIAVDGSRAGDRDVFLFKGIEEGRVVHQLNAFPASEDQRIFTGIARKPDCSARADVEIYIALQPYRASDEFSGGDQDSSSLCRVARGNRL